MDVETLNERAARQARQLASRKVTLAPRPCDCAWCSTTSPRAKRLLVNGLKPLTVKQVAP